MKIIKAFTDLLNNLFRSPDFYENRCQKCIDIGMERCPEGYRYGNEIIEIIYFKRASKSEFNAKFIATYEAISEIKERTKMLNKRFQERITQCEKAGAEMIKDKGILFGEFLISFNAIFNYADNIWEQQFEEAKKGLSTLKIISK